MLRVPSGRWNPESAANANSLQTPMPFARAGSLRLHGFQQKRALRGHGLRTDAEIKYLKSAAEGDVQMVERLFKKHTGEMLNRNCTDYFDRTALTLAITNGRERMIEYLLNAGVDLTESLFYAIDNEYTEAVEFILSSDTARRQNPEDMLITSEESIFPRFLSPIMLAAHKNNYEILETLYTHGHRLHDHSVYASNKWDEIRLKWLYYKARASQAYMILMWNKEKIDPLNEAIDFYGVLVKEGIRSREVRENLRQLAIQCEDFAIALLDQLRTAQELADLLRFTLVGREHGQTSQLVVSTLPAFITPSNSTDALDKRSLSQLTPEEESSVGGSYVSNATPSIKITESKNGGTLGRRTDIGNAARKASSADQQGAAEYIRSATNAESSSSKIDTLTRISMPGDAVLRVNDPNAKRHSVIEEVPDLRRRTLGVRRGHSLVPNTEYARPIHFLKPIEKAVDNGMIRLVTCENSQLALTYLKDGLLFRDTSPSLQLFLKFLIGLMFPFISIAFYFRPNSKLGLVARNPTAKLWMEVASDIILIGLLVLNLFLSEFGVIKPSDFSPILITAYFWMPGKFINLSFLAYHQGKRVIYSIWNWNDFATILLYTTFMILRISGDQSNTQWSPIPVSDMMISVVYILVFLRPLEILRVNRTFGPLQVSVDRMMRDVSKFFLLFLVIWFAFSSGVNTLYWRYKGVYSNSSCRSDPSKPNSSAPTCCFENKNSAKFTDFGISLQVHFWSIFGYSDEYAEWFAMKCNDNQDRTVTAKFGETIFALYHVGTVLVLVNMLIAIMSGTLQKTIDESDIQWQFHRTRVWIRFIRTGFYRPPPMNIVPRPKEIVFIGKMIAKRIGNWCRSRRSLDMRRNDYRHETEGPPTEIPDSSKNSKKITFDSGKVQHQETRFGHRISRASLGSVTESMEEEIGSRYDLTLRKCVKRYLKARVVQGDGVQDSSASPSGP